MLFELVLLVVFVFLLFKWFLEIWFFFLIEFVNFLLCGLVFFFLERVLGLFFFVNWILKFVLELWFDFGNFIGK